MIQQIRQSVLFRSFVTVLIALATTLVVTSTSANAQVLAWARLSEGAISSPFVKVPYGAGLETQSTADVDAQGNTVAVVPARQPFGLDLYDDYYVLKVAPSGQVIWRRRVDGWASGPDMPYAVASDLNGDVVVTGRTVNGSGGHDVLTVKLAGTTGLTLWRSLVPGIDATRPTAGRELEISPDGDVFVAAETSGLQSGEDVLLFKLAGESGALLWRNTYQRSVGAWSHDRAAAMILGPDGDLFVGCSTESVISGGDASVLKISGVDGQVVWVRHLQGEGGATTESAVDLEMAQDGRVILLVNALTDLTAQDYLTIALDASDGDETWRVWYSGAGGARDDSPSDLAVDMAGDIVVTGRSENAAGDRDFATVSYAVEDGAQRWVARYDAAGEHEDAIAVVAGFPGSVLVSGIGRSVAADEGFLTISYSISDGQEQWLRRYDHAMGPLRDRVLSMGVDSVGDPRVVGVSWDGADTSLDVIRYRAADGDLLWASDEGIPDDEPESLGCMDMQANLLQMDLTGGFFVVSCAEISGAPFSVVTKRDSDGNAIWRYQADPAEWAMHRISGVSDDSAGDLLVTGDSRLIDGASGIFAIKFDRQRGEEIWRRFFPIESGNSESSVAVLVAENGDVVIASDLDRHGGDDDTRVRKLAPGDGSTIWTIDLSSAIGYPGNEQHARLASAANGDVFLAAYSEIGVGSDMLVSRIDADSGQVVWSHRYDSPNGLFDIPTSSATDPQGNLFVMGSAMVGDHRRMILVKFDGLSGSVQWDRRDLHELALGAEPGAMAVGDDGGAVLLGAVEDELHTRRMFTVSVDGDTGSTRWTTRSSISNSLVTQYGSSVLLGAAGELYAIGSSARGQAKWVPVIEKYRALDGGLIWRFEHAVGDNSWYPCCARQTEDGSLLIAAQAKTDFGERVGLLKLLDRPPTHPDTLFADSFD